MSAMLRHLRGCTMVMTEALRELTGQVSEAKLDALSECVTRYRAELKALEGPGAQGMALARMHSALADKLVLGVFEQVRDRCNDRTLLLGAVGGYGRGLIAPGSDLDLCFITTAPEEAVSGCVKAMLYPLWDAGIRVGHQVVRPSEVVSDALSHLSMATELLDFRPLAGDASLLPALQQRLAESVFSEHKIGLFIGQLEAQAKKRHQQFGDSVYLLEPDVKNGVGGLRDLDSALWAARARFGSSSLAELAKLKVVTEQTEQDTERALDFLWTVRNQLHHLAGRKADRLTFGEQERVAGAMGYAQPDGAALPRLQRIGEMVEAFMSDYYRHARVIAQTHFRLLGRAKRRQSGGPPRAIPLADGLIECEGKVGLEKPERVRAEPLLALQVYAIAMARDMQVLSLTRDAIAAAMEEPDICERLRQCKKAAELWIALVCSNKAGAFAVGSILTELHDVGLLVAMIPEFAPVVGRVHHDLYHVYTVDVHSIAAVDRLHALARGELASAYPLASRLAAETARPRVLFMATLLHDVGKAIGGRNHARRGAEMARDILARLGFTPDEIDDVSRLVLHHLTMYMVAIRRDLNDPATIAEFVRDTWDREGLRELYLLTLADVSTTSNQAMTTWKRGMLDALFRGSDAFLAGSLARPTARVAQAKNAVLARWRDPASIEALHGYLASMPQRYFLANSPEEIVAHAELALGASDEPVVVSWVTSSQDGILGLCVVTEEQRVMDLCVVANDRPGLLASITAAISASHFDIQAAQVNSRRLPNGSVQAVDVFWVRSPHENARERRFARLKRNVAAVIRGEVAPEDLVELRLASSRSSRPTPAVVNEVLFDHHASDQYTVIEVLAEDRPALLFSLARALRELDISVTLAKISTEGKRAVDVLYATEADGSKVASGARTEEVRQKLMSCLSAGAARASE